MHRFAFVIHPVDVKRDAARKYPIAKYLPERWVEQILMRKEPMVVSHITGLQSLTGATAEGWFIGCPLSPRMMLSLPLEFVYRKIIRCGQIAQELGAEIIGLGAFTSVVGDGGITIAKSLDIAVTTGNSYTVATAIEAAILGAEKMGVPIGEATVAVVGATGSIGRTCAEALAPHAKTMLLLGRHEARLEPIAAQLRPHARGDVRVSADLARDLPNADVVITVTSAVDAVIYPKHLKSGAVVVDVARPRDVSVRVAQERADVLVIEGGLVEAPGKVDFGFDFGFPPRMAYACMSETMMLALDGRIENFTLGKEVSLQQVAETQQLAQKHGFRLAGFRSFERALTDSEIEAIRERAKRAVAV
ncbi:MAG: shikimate 5-dehydrogenase [Fimbriimonadales bacterium]|nr:MAG: shikimate 5-dehydrogenase [Fimbriimonadales bacterium]GIV10553.1 MAG: shikimate 5-dehydrogenase [Fimbriimonadales bacterium]